MIDVAVLVAVLVGRYAITFLRVVLLVIVAMVVSVPVGVWIGFNPRIARLAQPVVQVLASSRQLPLPLATLAFIHVGIGLDVGGVVLTSLGARWHILFNAIAVTRPRPRDRCAPEFKALLDHVYGVMAGREIEHELARPAPAGPAGAPAGQVMLPHASVDGLSGLLEILRDGGGTLGEGFFLDVPRRHYTADEAGAQLDTAIDWGRYGELYEYDAGAGRIRRHAED